MKAVISFVAVLAVAAGIVQGQQAPEIGAGAELVAQVRAVYGAQLKAIQKLQVEWELVWLSAEGKPIGGTYFGREVWDGHKRYRTGMRGGDLGRGLFIDFAGEAAWDGVLASSRVSLSPTVRWSSDTNAITEAGVGGFFERFTSFHRTLGLPRITMNERNPEVLRLSAVRDSQATSAVWITYEMASGVRVRVRYDLSRGGWNVASESFDRNGEPRMQMRVNRMLQLKSAGNVIWIPGELEEVHFATLPDGSDGTSRLRYRLREDFVAVNEHATWKVPFRLYPAQSEVLWDKRLSATSPATRPAHPSGVPGWGYQEMERINTEFRKRNPRPTTQVTTTQPASDKSTAVSEPTQWMWLIAVGAGILLVALGIVIKIRRASA